MEEKDRNRKIIQSTFAVAAPTLLSRILGYLRDMIQAFYLGTSGSMDAFSIAYIIPNLLRRLTAEGAMTAAFVPVFTQLKKDKSREELWKFANAFFFDLTLIIVLLAVLGIVFSPFLVKIIAYGFKGTQGKWELTIVLTKIMFPYICLISLAALAGAILNSFHKFFVPAFTPVLFNLAIISGALLFARKAEEPAFVFAVGVVIGGIFQLAFQVPFLWRRGMRFRPMLSFSHPAVRKVTNLLIPGIFGAGIYQVNFAISRMMASSLEEGSISSLYYSSRIEEITLGLFSIALSIALLPTFSDLAAQGDIPGMKKTLIFSLKLAFLVTIPAMAGLLALSRPIVQVLFQRGVFNAQSTSMTSTCLLFFSFGLPFISGVKILAPSFYSLKDTRTPVIVAIFVMLSYISLSLVLMKSLNVGGIAFALSLSSFLNFVLLFFLLERKIGSVEKRELIVSAVKSVLSAALMGALVWLFIGRFGFNRLAFLYQLGLLLSAIVLGIMVYFILSLFLNREDLKHLREIISRKRSLKEERKG
jgi:putative peptidoglycan lipid II flippase